MKSFVITQLILTIFYIVLIRSENEHGDHCYAESQRQDRIQRHCMDAIYNSGDFSPKVNQTLADYDGDVDTVRRFALHYCPILKRVLNCLPLGLNVSEDCRTPLYYESDIVRYRVLDDMLGWACDNDAEILVEILRDDGLKTFMFSNEFDRCSRILSVTPAYVGNAAAFVINPEYCAALQLVLDCYKDLVQSHKNRNLVRLAGEIYLRVRDVWDC